MDTVDQESYSVWYTAEGEQANKRHNQVSIQSVAIDLAVCVKEAKEKLLKSS